jgi:hypothetical protein
MLRKEQNEDLCLLHDEYNLAIVRSLLVAPPLMASFSFGSAQLNNEEAETDTNADTVYRHVP